jgi:uncharacterized protein
MGPLTLVKNTIRECESAVIAFSGGVDSSLVCLIARHVLGDSAVAVTVTSPIISSTDIRISELVAGHIGIEHICTAIDLLEDERFFSNPPDRCYYCKHRVFEKLDAIRKRLKFKKLMDGTNFDDLSKSRPGLKALEEFDVVSPLALSKLGKKEVRKLAAEVGLPNAELPSNTCFATRIPFGQPITRKKLKRISKSEEFIHSLGFKVVRVRDLDDKAKVEVGRGELESAKKLEKKIVSGLKDRGYKEVCLDQEGYRPSQVPP